MVLSLVRVCVCVCVFRWRSTARGSGLSVCGVTYLVLAGQVNRQCEADDQNPEIRVPNWSPDA